MAMVMVISVFHPTAAIITVLMSQLVRYHTRGEKLMRLEGFRFSTIILTAILEPDLDNASTESVRIYIQARGLILANILVLPSPPGKRDPRCLPGSSCPVWDSSDILPLGLRGPPDYIYHEHAG